MKRLLLLGSMVLLFATGEVLAQERTVSGRVTSTEDGSALPGVNVVLKGTTVGTATDADGRYSLSIPASGGLLVFSFIGLQTQEIPIGDRTTVDISLALDATQLSEVVVTALGIERNKNELPYAAQEVRGDEVVKNRQGNFVNALSGKIAGVDIKSANTMGGSTNVVIRGYSSISNNNQALFVIDGVPVSNANINTSAQRGGGAGADYGNAAADINPDNIASINVLKGAAATALYGSRGMNGVVMITTKKGRKNSMEVVVNSGITWGTMDTSTFARYQKEYGAGYILTFPGTLTLDDGTLPHQHYQADASYGPKFEGQMVYQWDALDPLHPNYRKATPWLAAKNDPSTFFETSTTSNQSIFVSGGTDKAVFKFGYTRTDEKGYLPNSSLDKNLFNFTASYDLTSKLKVEASANVSTVEGMGRYGTGYSGFNINQQFRQWWATNVDIQEQREAYFRNRQNITWNWSSTAGTGPIYFDNPYWMRYENYRNDSRLNFFGYVLASYKVTDWLELLGRAGTNTTNDMQEERNAVGSVGVSSYARFNRGFVESNFDFIANLNKKISDDFVIRGLIGSNIRRSKAESIRASTNGGLVVPKLYSLSNTFSPMAPPGETYERIGVDGIFASATLGYRDMIFLDVSARQDKSTTLPADNNAYFYPSVASSFVFSKLLSFDWLSHAKARVNYAEVGNDAPALSVNTVYTKPVAMENVQLFSLPITQNNANLKSERQQSIEAGIDADFFDGRFGFDFTWYKSSTFDQIIPIALTTATGYSSKWINSGEVENKGIEVSAFVVPVKTDNFSWTVNINYSRNRNQVIELYGEGEQKVTNVPIQNFQGGVSLNATVGHPYGVIRGTDFVYTNGQKTVNSAGYYMATPDANHVIGDPNPDWLGGINNLLKYKNVSLSFLIDIRQGGDIFSLDQFYGDGSGLYTETAGLNDQGNSTRAPLGDGGGIILPGVKQDGTPNDIYAANHNGSGATAFGYAANSGAGTPRAFYVYDGSYVKLREFALSYRVPTSFLANNLKSFKAIEVSAIGRNLWIISKNMKYSDPEESLSSGNANQGYQSGAYPAQRTYGFNVRLTF